MLEALKKGRCVWKIFRSPLTSKQTLVTALCAVVMLGRRLSTAQWTSLLVLAAGVATMQIGAAYARSVDPHPHVALPEGGSMEHATGLAAVLVSCFCSAVAATYFEVVLKRPPVVPAVQEYLLVAPPDIKPTSLWVRNIQLSLFSSVLGIGLVTLQRNHDLYMGEGGLSLDFRGLADPLEHWYDPVVVAAQDFFDGFHPIIWAVIGLQIVGGLLIGSSVRGDSCFFALIGSNRSYGHQVRRQRRQRICAFDLNGVHVLVIRDTVQFSTLGIVNSRRKCSGRCNIDLRDGWTNPRTPLQLETS